MISLNDIRTSNDHISSSLPPRLVAVFVGGTSGVGETSLKEFAKYTVQPRIYYIGRSQEAADRISKECKALNPQGEYIFIKGDTSLIKNVDDICRDIKSREKTINLLFLTIGSLIFGTETSEHLHYAAALVIYCRTRFIVNLLPLLESAHSLRRVVSVMTGTKEGPIDTKDWQALHVPFVQQRGHAASFITLSLEALAQKAPTVSFIHNFPGTVKGGVARGTTGFGMALAKVVFKVIMPLFHMNFVEAGDRQVFVATSARFPPAASTGSKEGDDLAAGVPLPANMTVARGTDGKLGSGVYSTDVQDCESAGPAVEKLLQGFRDDGLRDKAWENIREEFVRITGTESV